MSKAYSISTVFWIPCNHEEANDDDEDEEANIL